MRETRHIRDGRGHTPPVGVGHADPLGRHSPRRKISSATAPPRITQSANTGCRCIGFHDRPRLDVCALEARADPSRAAPNASLDGDDRSASSVDVRRSGASGMKRDAGHVGERGAVARVDRGGAATRLSSSAASWPRPTRGEQVAHAVVEADLAVLVVRRRIARLRGQVPRAFDRASGVVGHQHAAAAGGDDLVAVEREHADARRTSRRGRPRYVAPSASAASSISGTP